MVKIPADSAGNEVADFRVIDGIVHARFKNGVLIDLEAAKVCVRQRQLIQGGKPMPLLLDITGLKELTKAAREYFSSAESLADTTAGVLLTNNSIFVRTMANLYFILSRPSIPHRMFSDKDEAIAWLNQHR